MHVGGDILSDRGVGTTTGLDRADSVGIECLVADEELLVFLRA
jgi:hypothetical protein